MINIHICAMLGEELLLHVSGCSTQCWLRPRHKTSLVLWV